MTQTWVIRQGNKGEMYFGTSKGVTTFDGTHWQTLKLANNSAVRSMAISKNGITYVGGMDELGYLKPNALGALEYISLNDKITPDSRNFGVVKEIYSLKNDMVFLCDTRLFLLREDSLYDIKNNTFFERGFLDSDQLYVFERNSKLKKLSNITLIDANDPVTLSENTLITILNGAPGKKIAFSMGQGALKANSELFTSFNAQENQFLIQNKINCGINLKNSNIVLGTVLGGLVVLDAQGKTLLKLNSDQGLDNNNILTLFEDCYDNLWVGHDNGVTYIEINSPFTAISKPIVSGIGYCSIIHKNTLYLGTSQGLFASTIEDHQTNWKLPKFELISGTEGVVRSLVVVDGVLLMGHENGTYILEDLKARLINPIHGGWCYQKLKSNPDYMIEGCYSGLLLYKKNGNSWNFIQRIKGYYNSSRVLEQDDQGRIWIAHGYIGLIRLKLDNALENATNTVFYGKKNGFPSNLGINVFKIDNELIFTCEKGGLYNYDEKRDSFTINASFIQNLGPIPHISKLSEQPSGNIWVNELDRIGILLKQNNQTYRYDSQAFNKLGESMIPGFEHFQTLENNSVLFGYGYGFIHYDPSKQKDYNCPYYTILSKVEITNQNDSAVFKLDTTQILPSKYNSLRFSFSAPFFENMASTRYSYCLDGFDSKWSEWTAKTDREYTNLTEGSYTFSVKAKNVYGVESYPAVCKFTINPPLNRTWYAYLLYLIIGITIFYQAVRIYTQKREETHQQENVLKDQEIVKLKNIQLSNDLEHKNNELSNLATQLVNKNAILQQIKEYLNTIYQNLGAKDQKEIISLTRKISSEADTDKEWNIIEPHFDSVHQGFLTKLRARYPELRPHDLKLCAYIRMNLSSKEIAVLMNNTPHGVEAHRYRLRKAFEFNREDNLKDFLGTL